MGSLARKTIERCADMAKIDPTDDEIDQLVYELYGVTEDEIRIVEEAMG